MKNTRIALLLISVVTAALLIPLPSDAREPAKPTSKIPQAQKLINMAWAALDNEMGVKEIDIAIGFLEKAAVLDPDNDLLLCEMANEYFQRGYQMPAGSVGQIEARNAYFQKGYDAAQKALSIRESAGAHAWTAANLGALKQYTNFVTQTAILPEINNHLDWITTNDKQYKYGLVTRFWAGILTRAPDAIVKLLGEDPEGILRDLENVISREPRYIENYLYKAEYLYSAKKRTEALDCLDEAIKMDPNALPEERAYNRFMQRTAREFWKEWTGKNYPER